LPSSITWQTMKVYSDDFVCCFRLTIRLGVKSRMHLEVNA
jgi:hypothetical protein